MATTLFSVPDEILFKVIHFITSGDTPMDLSFFIDTDKYPDQAEYNSQRMQPSCNHPQCNSFSTSKLQPRHACFGWHNFPQSQEEHLANWIVSNGVSHHWRACAKEVFFSKKTFSINPELLKRLSDGKVKTMSTGNTELLFKHARRIIVPLPACSEASGFLTLPRYHRFNHLSTMVLWPGRAPGEDFPDFAIGNLRQEMADEELRTLLDGIGLRVAEVRIDIIRSGDEREWRERQSQMKRVVYPYLRFVGEQRSRNNITKHGTTT
ncbi:hypothetical protein MMC21_003269 [Puttea exsequens]|nr:hypothetical protein [Puttea exsequens]